MQTFTKNEKEHASKFKFFYQYQNVCILKFRFAVLFVTTLLLKRQFICIINQPKYRQGFLFPERYLLFFRSNENISSRLSGVIDSLC